jgi:hypothetical protein
MISHNEHEFKFLTNLNHSTLCCHLSYNDISSCPLDPILTIQFVHFVQWWWNNSKTTLALTSLISLVFEKLFLCFKKIPKLFQFLFLKFPYPFHVPKCFQFSNAWRSIQNCFNWCFKKIALHNEQVNFEWVENILD